MSKTVKKIIAITLIVVVFAGLIAGGYFAVKYFLPDNRERVAITSQITFTDANLMFNVETQAEGHTTLKYNLSSANELKYKKANVSFDLPEYCKDYEEMYFTFHASNINQIVIEVGSSIYFINTIKVGDNTVSFKVDDFGNNPRVYIYPDTYGADLSSAFNNNKTVTFTQIGFIAKEVAK